MKNTSKIIIGIAALLCVAGSLSFASHNINRLASISSVFVQSTSTATSTTTHKPMVPSSITLKLGQKSVMVAILQNALIKDGYLSGSSTGIFTTSTQIAVETLQKNNGWQVTGYLEISTSSISSIFASAAASSSFNPIAIGTTGVQATALQKFLITKGDLKITTTTSYFGSLTQAALKAFQKSHNLPQTGIVDPVTFAAMNGK